jgi:3-dehydroquinate synthase
MEDSLVFDSLVIKSHKGPYSVAFGEHFVDELSPLFNADAHFLVDHNIARLYGSRLRAILARPSTVIIEANEESKSLERTIHVFEQLIASKVRRGQYLVAIGGGVVQDITCFVASTLLRGLPWSFLPTTLLAQADSCIGSKSSINLGSVKNIIGTFNPPQQIYIWSEFLNTLKSEDIQSGIGEIIKVHAIDSIESFDSLAKEFPKLYSDREVLLRYMHDALLIKKRFIEADEFDTGIRNIFNYGHSFGHAIESVTGYGVPHGIAVTIGMDMANFIAVERGLLPKSHYHRMRDVLKINYGGYTKLNIETDTLIDALTKDKKNGTTMLRLIFPVGDRASIERVDVPPDSEFREQCMHYLEEFST